MDEDVLARVRLYLRQNKLKIDPAEFIEHVNHQILPNAGRTKVISGKTAIRWMQRLGLQYSEARKGMFVDGHERPDVLEYRTIFFKRMADLEVQVPISSGKEMEIDNWPVGEPIILVTHDERPSWHTWSEESMAVGWSATTSKKRSCKINPCQRILV